METPKRLACEDRELVTIDGKTYTEAELKALKTLKGIAEVE